MIAFGYDVWQEAVMRHSAAPKCAIEILEARIAPASTVFDLTTLNGANGFVANGAVAQEQAGDKVGGGGDFNGDGFDDLLIGAIHSSAGGMNSGAVYVVFGKATGFAASIDLGTLNGTNGFRISGEAAGDQLNFLANVGDINHDGIDDIGVGARLNDSTGGNSGECYVIYGKNTAFAANLNLAGLAAADGFSIAGEQANDTCARIGPAGDLNGDGIDDLAIGSSNFGIPGTADNIGRGYVIFGKSGNFGTSVSLAGLNGTTGFKLTYNTASGFAGSQIGSPGDINHDGHDDLYISVPAVEAGNAGRVYVLFSKTTAWANVDVTTISGAAGFACDGEVSNNQAGGAVSPAGDVNGDGIDDLLIGARFNFAVGGGLGNAYVVYGRDTAFPNVIPLASLDGTNGFKIICPPSANEAGFAAAGVGDVNDDGFADILIGSYQSDTVNGTKSGEAYLIYGQSTFTATVTLSNFTGVTGVVFHGVAANDVFGISVGAAGDMNNDGYADYVIGSGHPFTVVAGPDTQKGASYVIFGGPADVAPPGGGVTIAKNGKSATFTDVDGDKVTVKTTKGKFTVDMFDVSAEGLGFHLDTLHLTDPLMAKTNLTFSAKPQDVNHDGTKDGDKLVNVGAIDGVGKDLGAVSLPGVLGKITAGDAVLETGGLKSLKVGGLGKVVIATPGTDYYTEIMGKLGSLTVMHDVIGAEVEATGGMLGNIGKIKIGGSLIGDAESDSGSIYATGNMGAVKIGGSIFGGAGDYSGRIATGAAPVGGSIKSVTVGGSLEGGIGLQSGEIGSDTTIGSIKIGGGIDGGIINIAGRANPTKPKNALALKSLTVTGNITDAFIGIGYLSNGVAINADVQVGAITVGGNWTGSSLAVGVQDSTHDGFGQNDTLIANGSDTIVAQIASITIKGTATGTAAAGDFFGFTAELVKKAKIHGTKLALTANKDDLSLDPTNNDFHIIEI